MKKSLTALLFCLFCIVSLSAQESRTAYGILRLPVAAGVAAQGGENVSAMSDEPGIGLHNPALLSAVPPHAVGISFMSYADGARWLGAQYARAFGPRHTAAACLQLMDYGTFAHTDAEGANLGTFNARETIVGMGYSYLLSDRWAGGANLKTLYSSLAGYHAAALAVDLGLNYYDELQDLSLSFAVRNLGAQLESYNRRNESIPYSLQVGLTKGLEHLPFQFSITAIDLTRWSQHHYFVADGGKMGTARLLLNHLVLGAELRPTEVVRLSVGYNFRRAYELKAAGAGHGAGLSAGLGLHLSRFDFRIAYARYHKATSSLHGSLTVRL